MNNKFTQIILLTILTISNLNIFTAIDPFSENESLRMMFTPASLSWSKFQSLGKLDLLEEWDSLIKKYENEENIVQNIDTDAVFNNMKELALAMFTALYINLLQTYKNDAAIHQQDIYLYIQEIIDRAHRIGLDIEDIYNLEELSQKATLEAFPDIHIKFTSSKPSIKDYGKRLLQNVKEGISDIEFKAKALLDDDNEFMAEENKGVKKLKQAFTSAGKKLKEVKRKILQEKPIYKYIDEDDNF